MIVRAMPLGPVQANCYIVGCDATKKAVIIDPGDDAPRIIKAAEDLELEVIGILLTHAHFDHMGAAAEVSEALGLPVALHSEDQPLLDSGGGATLFGFATPPIPTQIVHLSEGQEIVVGDLTLQVMFTPGHAPGHISFHEVAEKALFDGDVIFAGSIGRTDIPGADYDDMMHSVEALLALPDETMLYPGHGPVTTIGRERESNPWF
jgi:hydroxyacylglutathione hydrolase